MLDRRVMLIHLSGELSFEFLSFLQVRSDFLFLPEFPVDSLSARRRNNNNNRDLHATETNQR